MDTNDLKTVMTYAVSAHFKKVRLMQTMAQLQISESYKVT